jgi:hypothetical protein
MATERKIPTCTFDSTSQRWNMESGSMAEAMFEWLRNPVPGENEQLADFRGFELLGMLHPDDPNPANYTPPPKWLSPELLMKGSCAWTAGAMQDFMFSTGMAPIVRANISSDGVVDGLTVAGGIVADITSSTIEVTTTAGDTVLSETSTVSITAIGGGKPTIQVIQNEDKGWTYSIVDVDGVTLSYGAYIHVFM